MKAKLHRLIRQCLIALGLVEAPRLQPIPVRRQPAPRDPRHS
ncbi:conserved hypothetical protein [Pseudomonas sp. 8AS]|nr:PA1414 family protein [Pseudomonas sp. 8AS]VXC45967.1 conserved hypothetical protein [Pseudomonas sp. 8AS]